MNFDKLPEIQDTPKTAVSPRKLRRWLWVFLIGLAGVASWQWQQQRKKESSDTARAARIVEIREKEMRLAEVANDIPRLEADRPAQLRMIESGLALVEEIGRLRPRPEPKDATRLFEWQARRDEARATLASAESRQFEEESGSKLSAGDREAAIDLIKRAWKLQREINASAASQAYKNYGRETRLAGEAERLEAEPLGETVAAAQAEAEKAVAGSDWSRALEAYRRAREAQEQINRDYPRSRYADIEGLTKIGREISALEAVEPMQKLDQSLAQARAAGSDRAAALRFFREALDWQQRINAAHGQSRFASTERAAEIEREIQTREAATAWEELGELGRRIAAHLARRELFQAQELLAQSARAMEQAATRWPKAQGAPEELRLRLTFLALRAADLAAVQDQVYGMLRPLSGRDGVAMLVSEVPQGLFNSVMNFNPSKAPGKESPVDSVARTEAEEFCRRLGWLMGRIVRLPARDDYVSALRVAGNGWGLADGLAEWVGGEPTAESGRVVLAGGATLPGEKLAGHDGLWMLAGAERSALVGFRVVMETNLSRAER